MDIIFKGTQQEIEKFVREIIYPVIWQRQKETEGHYFRFTDDKGDYQSRKKDNIYVRRIRGYFPGMYYKVDMYADKYKEDYERYPEGSAPTLKTEDKPSLKADKPVWTIKGSEK